MIPQFLSDTTIRPKVSLSRIRAPIQRCCKHFRSCYRSNFCSPISILCQPLYPQRCEAFPGGAEYHALSQCWRRGVKVHEGFACTQGRTADTILSTVKSGLQNTMFRNVFVTRHSLGAAVAVLDALMLRHHLDPTISINTIVFAPPRGGDQHLPISSTQRSGPLSCWRLCDPPGPETPAARGTRHCNSSAATTPTSHTGMTQCQIYLCVS